ncbi:MAG: transglycosylase domain-containing protein [Myxococcales bacterium]|jgi:hypothetical protein|nr:transglycosylase domain-containing protein [Myxococcales bacterium]
MGPKRWILTIAISLLIIALLVLFFFQSGTDRRVVEMVLPRIESRYGVLLRYEKVQVSLTSVVFSSLSVLPAADAQPLMTAERLGVHLRIGPLIKGEIDITEVRIDGLRLLVGEGAGGAEPQHWKAFWGRVSQPEPPVSAQGAPANATVSPERKLPDIHITSGMAVVHIGSFEATVDSFSGHAQTPKEFVLEMRGYRLKHHDLYLARGTPAQATWHFDERRLAVQLNKPTYEIPGDVAQLQQIAREGAQALENLGLWRGDASQASEASSGVKAVDAAVEWRASQATVLYPEARDNIIISEADGRWHRGADRAVLFSGSGKLPRSNSRWNAEGRMDKDRVLTAALELPDMALQPFSAALFRHFPALSALQLESAMADGRLRITVPADRATVGVEGQVALAGVGLQHPRISASPLEALNGQIDLKVAWHRAEKNLHIERWHISQGLARLALAGTWQPSPLKVDLTAELPSTACRQLLTAIPQALRPQISGVRLDGQLSFQLHLGLDILNPEATVLKGDLQNRCQIADFGALPDPAEFRVPFAYMAYNESGQRFRLITGPGTERWAPLNEISPYVVEAVLTTEDGKFYTHKGMTLPEMRRAMEMNLKKDGAFHGASTITMQLAKNLFLSRERTVARKLQELFFTWYLESHFTKEEILEMYLNIVEFGPSIYGVLDAAKHYFGREPQELNLVESVYLIKLLPNPVARHKTRESGQLSAKQMRLLHQVMGVMLKRGRISRNEYEQGLAEKVVFYREGDPLPDPRLPPAHGSLGLSGAADDWSGDAAWDKSDDDFDEP